MFGVLHLGLNPFDIIHLDSEPATSQFIDISKLLKLEFLLELAIFLFGIHSCWLIEECFLHETDVGVTLFPCVT